MDANAKAESFIVTDASTWLARGRTVEHAEALARIWREYPDLPITAAPEDRMARCRQRAIAMKPINAAIQAQTERDRQHRNFAFIEAKAASGSIEKQDLAILRGRDNHGYDWNDSVRYAQGWYAAHAGWPYRCPAESSSAYDHGFRDGGGDRSDLFDAARRTFTAAERISNQPPVERGSVVSRPLPSTWLKPTDQPRPTRWSRRLAILTGSDLNEVKAKGTGFLQQLLAAPGSGQMTIVVLTPQFKFVMASDLAEKPSKPNTLTAPDRADQLRALLAGREFDDILTTAQRPYLGALDAVAEALPLARNQERTRNTWLQQRAHLRTWLERGLASGENMGAGHIRWSKVIQGLTGKLGEFTARYVGPAGARGHLISIDLPDGSPAGGFITATGVALEPRILITNKSRLRQEMANALRSFGGATRI